jgi:chemotaxis protein MotB
MVPQPKPQIHVVRKKRARHAHHGGAWKVAYADFVTAMMALFIVLWIVGQSEKVKQSVAGYFSDPVAFEEEVRKGGAVIADTAARAAQRMASQQEKLQKAGESILEALKKKPELSGLSEHVTMALVKEGLRIELLEKSESFFFDVGTSDLKREAVDVLGVIGSEIGKMPNNVIVEGHTDSRPYNRPDGYTNFELSADRANMARRILVERGLRSDQVDEVRGYADTRLRDRNDPLNLTNRRISIIIEFDEEELREQVAPAASPTPVR